MIYAITGGLGFLGFNLAKHLTSKGHDIIIFDNMSRKGSEHNLQFLKQLHMPKKPQSITTVTSDLDDIPTKLKRYKVDLIYHFAAQVAVTKSYESPASDFRINAEGTFNLLRSVDVPVIFSSSNKVYGDNVNQIPIKEEQTRYDFDGEYSEKGIPETFSVDASKHTYYGCSKLVADIYTREFGGVVNRFSCLYGQSQFGDLNQGWVAHFIISKLKNQPVTIYGNGKQVRDILYSDDVVKLLELEALNIEKIRGEVFNIGGGYKNTISLLELCEMLDIHPMFEGWREADQKVYYSNISKARRILNWKPEIDAKEGINKLQKWWEDNKNLL